VTPHHAGISAAARDYLAAAHETFRNTVAATLAPATPCFVLDASLDASLADFARALRERGTRLDGVVHAIALDRAIRQGSAKALLDVTREEFLDCMNVSAYSLLGLLRVLLAEDVLARGASVVALSYLGAESRRRGHPWTPGSGRALRRSRTARQCIARRACARSAPPAAAGPRRQWRDPPRRRRLSRARLSLERP
jgi:enoyl-[acyl-carrier protein] reductase I